jgi:hypothetical protein
MLPDVVSLLVTEDYRLAVLKVPAEPPAVREGVNQLLAEGICGVLCCPTLYATVMAVTAGRLPVIVLWQGGAKALLAKIRGVNEVAAPAVAAPTAATIRPPPKVVPDTGMVVPPAREPVVV